MQLCKERDPLFVSNYGFKKKKKKKKTLGNCPVNFFFFQNKHLK